MTIVLTPYWSNGVQKLKMAPTRKLSFSFRHCLVASRDFIAPPKPAHGLTPPALDDDIHKLRCIAQLRSKDKAIEKYIYLTQLKDADHNMFYKLCLENMAVCFSNNAGRFSDLPSL